eukprot:m.141043 g.141043  ORF g.141043 m.141043 type:complete len:292 (-) comp16122_c0_seq1:1653-2528(-)
MGGSGSKPSKAEFLPYVEQITQEHESVEDKTIPTFLSKKQLKVSKQCIEPSNPVCRLRKATLITTSEVDIMAYVEPSSLPTEDKDKLYLNLIKLANIQDNNVVAVVGCNITAKQIQIGLTNCDGGTLRHYLAGSGQSLPLKDRMRLCSNLADGLAALDEAGFVHGEINVDNCFAAEGGYVFKLGPFFSGRNQVAFLSPELKQNTRELAAADDVWAFGVLLWSIFNGGQPPHADKTEDEIRQLQKVDLPALESMPSAVRDVVDKCMDLNPDARPDVFWLRAELADQVDGIED